MNHLLVITGSVTSAVRLQKELHRSGCLRAAVLHTPSYFNSGGCSYSVRVDERCRQQVLELAEKRDITIKKIYLETINGGERVYHDLS